MQHSSFSHPVSIYALFDPRDERVRYVGQSVNPERRLEQYQEKRSHGNTRLRLWLIELANHNLTPLLRVVETCPDTQTADLQERHWIRKHVAEGADLLNVCDGGVRSVTKALHCPRAEWMELLRRVRGLRKETRRVAVAVGNSCGTSKPAALKLSRALKEVDDARADLERLLNGLFPEWADEVTAALYD